MAFDALSAIFESYLPRRRTAANRNQKNQSAEEESHSADNQRYAHVIHNKIPKSQFSGQPRPLQRPG